MFWALLIAPFAVLALAAAVAKQGAVFRVAVALAGIFALIDAAMFWSLFAGSSSSTGGIGVGVVGLVQCGFAVAVLLASPFARKNK
jgi:hypothetical protein